MRFSVVSPNSSDSSTLRGDERRVGLAPTLASCAVLVLCLLGFFLLRNVYWGDPSIYLVYADRIAAGHWFEFNAGEFSSGSTSPLWAVILAVGFVLGDGVTLAKVIGCLFTVLALIATYWVIYGIARNAGLALLAMAAVTYFLLLPGLMIYETPLIVLLVDLAIWLISFDRLGALPIIWALIPLTRPECTILVVLNVAWIVSRKGLPPVRWIGAFLLAMMPAVLYFGTSYALLGQFSTSSVCRGYALRESLSLGNWEEYARYGLPIVPLLFVVAGRVLSRRIGLNGAIPTIIFSLAGVLATMPVAQQVIWNSGRHLPFDAIVERDMIEQVNSVVSPGDTILVYEVQDRYYLRDDVDLLSLDGLTDGKVAPYFQDIPGFLRHYRPRYWLANDAVYYRPYLAHSLLRQVVDQAPDVGSSVEIEGIQFTNVMDGLRPTDFYFANATRLYEIAYSSP